MAAGVVEVRRRENEKRVKENGMWCVNQEDSARPCAGRQAARRCGSYDPRQHSRGRNYHFITSYYNVLMPPLSPAGRLSLLADAATLSRWLAPSFVYCYND